MKMSTESPIDFSRPAEGGSDPHYSTTIYQKTTTTTGSNATTLPMFPASLLSPAMVPSDDDTKASGVSNDTSSPKPLTNKNIRSSSSSAVAASSSSSSTTKLGGKESNSSNCTTTTSSPLLHVHHNHHVTILDNSNNISASSKRTQQHDESNEEAPPRRDFLSASAIGNGRVTGTNSSRSTNTFHSESEKATPLTTLFATQPNSNNASSKNIKRNGENGARKESPEGTDSNSDTTNTRTPSSLRLASELDRRPLPQLPRPPSLLHTPTPHTPNTATPTPLSATAVDSVSPPITRTLTATVATPTDTAPAAELNQTIPIPQPSVVATPVETNSSRNGNDARGTFPLDNCQQSPEIALSAPEATTATSAIHSERDKLSIPPRTSEGLSLTDFLGSGVGAVTLDGHLAGPTALYMHHGRSNTSAAPSVLDNSTNIHNDSVVSRSVRPISGISNSYQQNIMNGYGDLASNSNEDRLHHHGSTNSTSTTNDHTNNTDREPSALLLGRSEALSHNELPAVMNLNERSLSLPAAMGGVYHTQLQKQNHPAVSSEKKAEEDRASRGLQSEKLKLDPSLLTSHQQQYLSVRGGLGGGVGGRISRGNSINSEHRVDTDESSSSYSHSAGPSSPQNPATGSPTAPSEGKNNKRRARVQVFDEKVKEEAEKGKGNAEVGAGMMSRETSLSFRFASPAGSPRRQQSIALARQMSSLGINVMSNYYLRNNNNNNNNTGNNISVPPTSSAAPSSPLSIFSSNKTEKNAGRNATNLGQLTRQQSISMKGMGMGPTTVSWGDSGVDASPMSALHQHGAGMGMVSSSSFAFKRQESEQYNAAGSPPMLGPSLSNTFLSHNHINTSSMISPKSLGGGGGLLQRTQSRRHVTSTLQRDANQQHNPMGGAMFRGGGGGINAFTAGISSTSPQSLQQQQSIGGFGIAAFQSFIFNRTLSDSLGDPLTQGHSPPRGSIQVPVKGVGGTTSRSASPVAGGKRSSYSENSRSAFPSIPKCLSMYNLNNNDNNATSNGFFDRNGSGEVSFGTAAGGNRPTSASVVSFSRHGTSSPVHDGHVRSARKEYRRHRSKLDKADTKKGTDLLPDFELASEEAADAWGRRGRKPKDGIRFRKAKKDQAKDTLPCDEEQRDSQTSEVTRVEVEHLPQEQTASWLSRLFLTYAPANMKRISEREKRKQKDVCEKSSSEQDEEPCPENGDVDNTFTPEVVNKMLACLDSLVLEDRSIDASFRSWGSTYLMQDPTADGSHNKALERDMLTRLVVTKKRMRTRFLEIRQMRRRAAAIAAAQQAAMFAEMNGNEHCVGETAGRHEEAGAGDSSDGADCGGAQNICTTGSSQAFAPAAFDTSFPLQRQTSSSVFACSANPHRQHSFVEYEAFENDKNQNHHHHYNTGNGVDSCPLDAHVLGRAASPIFPARAGAAPTGLSHDLCTPTSCTATSQGGAAAVTLDTVLSFRRAPSSFRLFRKSSKMRPRSPSSRLYGVPTRQGDSGAAPPHSGIDRAPPPVHDVSSSEFDDDDDYVEEVLNEDECLSYRISVRQPQHRGFSSKGASPAGSPRKKLNEGIDDDTAPLSLTVSGANASDSWQSIPTIGRQRRLSLQAANASLTISTAAVARQPEQDDSNKPRDDSESSPPAPNHDDSTTTQITVENHRVRGEAKQNTFPKMDNMLVETGSFALRVPCAAGPPLNRRHTAVGNSNESSPVPTDDNDNNNNDNNNNGNTNNDVQCEAPITLTLSAKPDCSDAMQTRVGSNSLSSNSHTANVLSCNVSNKGEDPCPPIFSIEISNEGTADSGDEIVFVGAATIDSSGGGSYAAPVSDERNAVAVNAVRGNNQNLLGAANSNFLLQPKRSTNDLSRGGNRSTAHTAAPLPNAAGGPWTPMLAPNIGDEQPHPVLELRGTVTSDDEDDEQQHHHHRPHAAATPLPSSLQPLSTTTDNLKPAVSLLLSPTSAETKKEANASPQGDAIGADKAEGNVLPGENRAKNVGEDKSKEVKGQVPEEGDEERPSRNPLSSLPSSSTLSVDSESDPNQKACPSHDYISIGRICWEIMKPFVPNLYLSLITVACPLGNIALLQYVSNFVEDYDQPFWWGLIYAVIALVLSWAQTLAVGQLGRVVGHSIQQLNGSLTLLLIRLCCMSESNVVIHSAGGSADAEAAGGSNAKAAAVVATATCNSQLIRQTTSSTSNGTPQSGSSNSSPASPAGVNASTSTAAPSPASPLTPADPNESLLGIDGERGKPVTSGQSIGFFEKEENPEEKLCEICKANKDRERREKAKGRQEKHRAALLEELGDSTTPLLQLLTSDVDVVSDYLPYLLFDGIRLIEIPAAFVYLAVIVGWPFVCPLAVFLVLIPLNKYTSEWYSRLYNEKIIASDRRSALVAEVITFIRVIKYYAWEAVMESRIVEARKEEIAILNRVLGAVVAFACESAIATPLMQLALFVTIHFVRAGGMGAMQVAVVYQAISIISIPGRNVTNLAMKGSEVLQVWSGIKRLQQYVNRQTHQRERHARQMQRLIEMEEDDEDSENELWEIDDKQVTATKKQGFKAWAGHFKQKGAKNGSKKRGIPSSASSLKSPTVVSKASSRAKSIAASEAEVIIIVGSADHTSSGGKETSKSNSHSISHNTEGLDSSTVVTAFGTGAPVVFSKSSNDGVGTAAGKRQNGASPTTSDDRSDTGFIHAIGATFSYRTCGIYNSEEADIDTLLDAEEDDADTLSSFNAIAESSGFSLRVPRFRAESGDLILLVGKVGSGKTTFIEGICGGTIATTKLAMRGRISIAPQEPWIVAGTVRNNIILDAPFDEERYRKVLWASALASDLKSFAHGDATMVGSRGSTLSGGQRQRLSIARALYREADIYLFDDPLSALDAHVGRQVFENALCDFLKHKTRIMSTHQLGLLPYADRIYVADNGVLLCEKIPETITEEPQPREGPLTALLRAWKNALEVLMTTGATASQLLPQSGLAHAPVGEHRPSTSSQPPNRSASPNGALTAIRHDSGTFSFDRHSHNATAALTAKPPYAATTIVAAGGTAVHVSADISSPLNSDTQNEGLLQLGDTQQTLSNSHFSVAGSPRHTAQSPIYLAKNRNNHQSFVYRSTPQGFGVRTMDVIETVDALQSQIADEAAELDERRQEMASRCSAVLSKSLSMTMRKRDAVVDKSILSPLGDEGYLIEVSKKGTSTESSCGALDVQAKALSRESSACLSTSTEASVTKSAPFPPKTCDTIETANSSSTKARNPLVPLGDSSLTENAIERAFSVVVTDGRPVVAGPEPNNEACVKGASHTTFSVPAVSFFHATITYLLTMGNAVFWVPLLVLQAFVVGFRCGSQWWLGRWTDGDTFGFEEATSSLAVLGVYAAALFLSAVSLAARAFLWRYGTLKPAKSLFERMLYNVVNAPSQFFDIFSSGNVLTRFTKDASRFESMIPSAMGNLISYAVEQLGRLIFIVALVPYFAPVALFIVIAAIILKPPPAVVTLKSLSDALMDPITELFVEGEMGSTSIRIFGLQELLVDRVAAAVDRCNSARYMLKVSFEFVRLRVGLVIAIVTGAIIVFITFLRSSMSASTASFILSTSLEIIAMVGDLVEQLANVSISLTSAIRVVEFAEMTIPGGARPPSVVAPKRSPSSSATSSINTDSCEIEMCASRDISNIPSSWPESPAITFSHVTAQYRLGLPVVIRDLNFTIAAGERIGVCGRTGSGKSTLIQCLLRMVPMLGNSTIIIDGIDTSLVPLERLRRSITVIPQEPVVFSGTVRFNLDPLGTTDDETLVKLLQRCQLLEYFSGNAGGEDTEDENAEREEKEDAPEGDTTALKSDLRKVSSGGQEQFCEESMKTLDITLSSDSLSVGQKQLLCLCRAAVRGTNILILDEATSSVDAVTDQLIQHITRDIFADCTILTIAHRVNTIIDYDRVLVLDKGSVLEFDSPRALISNPESTFKSLVEASKAK